MRPLPLLALLGCASGPEGLRPTPPGDGPVIVVDWEAEPLPELPFPNDLATRVDPTSVTGLRLNISQLATTQAEAEARVKLDELVGFGIYSPLTVAFDAPLDLDEIALRHPDDFFDPKHWDDDAFLVIDVDPASPGYLQPVELDVGHGRFPADVTQTDRYFPNDPRADSPSLIFEMGEEDTDGDGVLDPGEDTDNDGVLDHPNVYPLGGDPRDDLLTWYERETNTLIVRPVVPLREQTRYAVLLTNRLIGEDGLPVRSPWAYINHTRQTAALEPVLDALPQLGLGLDDLAYGWVFTTGRVTQDLVDLRHGLDGRGPFAALQRDYPAGITEALQLHARSDLPSPYRLPMSDVIAILLDLGLFDASAGAFLEASYRTFSSDIVAGAFVTPYLLADRDDGGRDDSDEWWQLDPLTGAFSAEPQRVPFTCVLPSPGAGFAQPYPVAWFGHGYGSSRFDLFGFAHAFNRVGMAACSMDFPGHGPTVSPDDEVLVEALLGAQDLLPFYSHLKDSRYRDLNNDGVRDSGGDQWSADPFHTRDMVRQSAVDWMAVIRGTDLCGIGRMTLVSETETGPVPTDETRLSCDWDDDGVPDLGGPGSETFLAGGSLGGINAGVAAGVMPEITAFAPIVPGGGTLDIGIRTEIGGAVEALAGRMLTPMFVGYPTETGGIEVVQIVNSVTDMVELHVATLDTLPAGGTVRIDNGGNGEVRDGMIPEDGRFRLAIPADALDAAEKREAVGMPEDGPAFGAVYSVPDNAILGDPLVLTVSDAAGAQLARIDSWESDVTFEGVTYPAGSRLVAAAHGGGHLRGSPKLRKLAGVLAAALEPGDAISYAPHWFLDPLDGAAPANVLMMPTAGDSIVSINSGIALARAAGLVEYREVDPRYGMTVDAWLIDRKVVQGLEEYGPYTDVNGYPALFDADDLDDGTDGTGAPSDAPLRSTVETASGASALRIPYVETTGTHGFALPDPALPFDINTFAINQVARFFASRGAVVSDDPCQERADCPDLRPLEVP